MVKAVATVVLASTVAVIVPVVTVSSCLISAAEAVPELIFALILSNPLNAVLSA